MRLAKYIAHAGVASRRHAERLIASGRVEVNGVCVTDPAHDVDERNEIRVEGRLVRPEVHEYFILNKPRGVVSTARDPQGRPKVTDLVRSASRLYPVGRLDRDSTGLVLLTNDGELADRLTHPRYEVKKAYRVRVEGTVPDSALRALRSGVELEDGRAASARVSVIERGPGFTVLEVVIHEGRKRQVRRMCKAVGHPVDELERVRLGPLELGGLKPGAARPLSAAEVAKLRRLTERRSGG